MPNPEYTTDKIPPQAVDSERCILASCLYDAAILEHALRDLAPGDFYNSANAALFGAMRETGSRDPLILADKLNGSSGMETPEQKQAFVFELAGNVGSTVDITLHIKRLKESAARRERIARAEKTIQDCHDHEKPLADFSFGLEDRVFIPTWDNCPPATEPLIELSNVRILTRGNLALLTACAGAGKSSVMEAACSAVLAPMNDALGLTVNGKSLLYIDTERSKADHHASWVRMARRAGIGESAAVPATVQFADIRAIENLKDRLSYLWGRLDTSEVPEIVLIDGIGDFVNDVNDPDVCPELVRRLLAIADIRNFGLMVSLHNNPAMNSDKARGVLGSELWRKAESVLMIEKVPGDDVRRLTTDYALGKNRGGSDAISSYFKWDNEQKMHVSCGAPAEAKGKTVCEREKIMELVGTRPAWSYNEMKAGVMDLLGKSEGTAKNRIRDLIALGKIIKSDGGTYSLADKDRPEMPDYVHN